MLKNICLLGLVLSTSSFAAAYSSSGPGCANEAVLAAAKASYQLHSSPTSTCGAKLLTSGDATETFLVCITDEEQPAEWVVVLEKFHVDEMGHTDNMCVTLHASAQQDGDIPNFPENFTGKVNTEECLVQGPSEVKCAAKL